MSKTQRHPAVAAASMIALGSLVLAGCAADGEDDPVTVEFWGWVNGTEQVVEMWNAEHQDIQIEYSRIDSMTAPTKLLTAVSAGNAPCIGQVGYTEMLNNVVNGMLLDVTDEAAQYKQDYVPFAWSFASPGGRTYGLPQDTGPVVMYYRADLFEEFGIDVPTTWEEYESAAAQVKAADPSVSLGVLPSTDPSVISAYAWQAGAEWFAVDGDEWRVDIDSPQTREVAEYWQTLVDDGSIEVANTWDAAFNQTLASGKVLSVVSAAWMGSLIAGNAAETAGKWAVAPMPSWTSAPVSANIGGSADAILKGCEYPEEALEFVHWMNSSEESMNILASPTGGGLYPAAVDALSFSVVNQENPFYGGQNLGEVFAAAAENVPEGWDWGPVTVESQQALAAVLADVSNGSGTLPEGLRAVEEASLEAMAAKGISGSAAE